MASGRPFAASGITVNKADGSMLVQTTGSELYRITYTGTGSVTPTKPDTSMAPLRQQRKALEIANLFVQYGVGFVPMPVSTAEEFDGLATQALAKMNKIVDAMDDSPVSGKGEQ